MPDDLSVDFARSIAGVVSGPAVDGSVDLAVELAEVFLVEDEGCVGFFVFGAWVGGVDLGDIIEDLGDPVIGSLHVLVGGGGVVFSKIEEGISVSSELANSLDGAERGK